MKWLSFRKIQGLCGILLPHPKSCIPVLSKILCFPSAWPLCPQHLAWLPSCPDRAPLTQHGGGLLLALEEPTSISGVRHVPASWMPRRVSHPPKHLLFNLIQTTEWDGAPETSRNVVSREMLWWATPNTHAHAHTHKHTHAIIWRHLDKKERQEKCTVF